MSLDKIREHPVPYIRSSATPPQSRQLSALRISTRVVHTAGVDFPSPHDLARAPLWENYVVSQTCAASLGLIPRSALAVGVEIESTRVLLRFRLAEVEDGDREDMTCIADELGDLLGPAVQLNYVFEVVSAPGLDPHDGVWWIFRSRDD